MPFSDEELIAYLLGDASAELSQRLEQRLAVDSELLERLTALRQMLGQFDSAAGVFEPPADLVDTTLKRIDHEAAASSADYGHLAREPKPLAKGTWLSPSPSAQPRRRALWDSTALTISLTVLCCLALPALVRVRFESRKAQCARNLELTGSELICYALNHPQGRFPFVPLEGRESFAGIYAIYLREAGGQISRAQLQCASLLGVTGLASQQHSGLASSERNDIPSFAELHQLALDKLQLVQQTIGGDYAYNLGVAEAGSPRAPKCQGRSQFAILADAPVIRLSDSRSRGASQQQFIAHEGKGINIFFDDGHVQFVSVKSLGVPGLVAPHMADNPFENQHGAHELGLHPQDASLAPSPFAPLGN